MLPPQPLKLQKNHHEIYWYKQTERKQYYRGGGGAKPYPKEETKEIYKKEASAYTQYLRSSWSTKDGGESH